MKQKQHKRNTLTQRSNSDPVQLIGTKEEWSRLGDIEWVIRNVGILRLIRLREMIATDARLPMPPIRVEPYAWVFPDRKRLIDGFSRPILIGSNFQFSAILPALSVVFIKDDILLRQLLCHEFAHCFWFINRIYSAQEKGLTFLNDSVEANSKMELYNIIVKTDRDKLINPAEWFGEWDANNFRYECDLADVFDALVKEYIENWLNRDLPIKSPNLHFSAPGIYIEPEIREHWRKLQKTI
jgi:hypothetical protein